MPRNGSTTPSDLLKRGMLRLEVTCGKCQRRGEYSVPKLAAELGPDAMLTYWLSEITADCPRKRSVAIYDQCGAQIPALAVL